MFYLSSPAVAPAAIRSFPMAAEGTNVRSAALWRNPDKSLFKFSFILHDNNQKKWRKFWHLKSGFYILIIDHIGFTNQLKVYLGMYLQTNTRLILDKKKFQQQCQMRQIKVLTQGRVCGKTLLLVQIAFLLLPEHQRPKKISQRTIGKKSSSRFSQVHCFANVNSRGIYHYPGRWSVYNVRLKPCNFRDDSWTKRKREWNLLVIRAREAAKQKDKLAILPNWEHPYSFFLMSKLNVSTFLIQWLWLHKTLQEHLHVSSRL